MIRETHMRAAICALMPDPMPSLHTSVVDDSVRSHATTSPQGASTLFEVWQESISTCMYPISAGSPSCLAFPIGYRRAP